MGNDSRKTTFQFNTNTGSTKIFDVENTIAEINYLIKQASDLRAYALVKDLHKLRAQVLIPNNPKKVIKSIEKKKSDSASLVLKMRGSGRTR